MVVEILRDVLSIFVMLISILHNVGERIKINLSKRFDGFLLGTVTIILVIMNEVK